MSENKNFFEIFGNFVVNNRIWAVLLTLIASFVVYAGLPNLRLDTDGRVFMGPNNPDKQTLDLFDNFWMAAFFRGGKGGGGATFLTCRLRENHFAHCSAFREGRLRK